MGRDASQAGLVWGSPRTESPEGQKELALRDPAKGRKEERGLGPSHLQEEGGPAGVLWLKPWGPLRLTGFPSAQRTLLKSQRGHLHGSVG